MFYMFDEIIFWFFVIALIVAFVKIHSLRSDLEKVNKKLNGLLGRRNNHSLSEEKVYEDLEKEISEISEHPRYIVGGQNIPEKTLQERVEENHKSEFNFGSKWLTIIGVVSVIFGVGFFLQYAFENDLISKPVRVILGFISGIAFVALGDLFKNKLKDWAHYIIGGGFALIMLSAYFGIEYGLYSNAVGFVLMILTTLMAGFLAHKLDSKILGGTTILAGFLAPILASTGTANEIVLFNYILILVLGMFWLVKKHGWNWMIWASLIGTGILYGGSFDEFYTNSVFWIYWIYLIIFFVIFAAAPVYAYFADREDGFKSYGNLAISAIAGGSFMLWSYWMFEKQISGTWNPVTYKLDKGLEVFKNFYWVIGLIPAVVYLILSKISLSKIRESSDKILLYFVIGMASFSIAMIPALQFSGKWITFAWLAEAVILALIYYKNNIKVFLNLGLVSLTAGIFRLFAIDDYLRTKEWVGKNLVSVYTPIFNERTLIYFIGVASIFTIAYFTFKKREKNIAKWLGVIANFIILFWIYLELRSNARAGYISGDLSSLLLSIFYLVYGGILIWIGVLKKYIGFRIFGLGLIAFVILKAYIVDIWDLSEIIRILAFVILGLFIILISFFYSKISENLKDFVRIDDNN